MTSVILARLFKLGAHGTRAGTEALAVVTTFISMAYIISVKPQMAGAIPPFLNSVRP